MNTENGSEGSNLVLFIGGGVVLLLLLAGAAFFLFGFGFNR